MKNLIIILISALMLLFVFYGCENNPVESIIAKPKLATEMGAVGGFSAYCVSNVVGSGITARGMCWSTFQAPTIADETTTDGTGTSRFTSLITGLSPFKQYFLRAYATNSAGTGYGEVISITTLDSLHDILLDVEGYCYKTVKIGTQWWMAENLRVTHYRNGDEIPKVTDIDVWSTLKDGAYCDYCDESCMVATYGRLYNFFAVIDNRKIAPAGWHVPNSDEWAMLCSHLCGSSMSGGKMKEAGLAHWQYPNSGADNASGFNALPAGVRAADGGYMYDRLLTAYWHSWQDVAAVNRRCFALYYDGAAGQNIPFTMRDGCSIRCVRD